MLGKLNNPEGTATHHSRLCGSEVSVDVKLDNNNCVSEFAHRVRACLLGQAAAGAMEKVVLGSSLDELLLLEENIFKMLIYENISAPSDKWPIMKILEVTKKYRARHSSIMLTFKSTSDAVRCAIKTKTTNIKP